MDKWSHAQENVGWNDLSIFKLAPLIVGNEYMIHTTLYNGYTVTCLSILGLKHCVFRWLGAVRWWTSSGPYTYGTGTWSIAVTVINTAFVILIYLETSIEFNTIVISVLNREIHISHILCLNSALNYHVTKVLARPIICPWRSRRKEISLQSCHAIWSSSY